MGNILTATGLTLNAALDKAYQYRVKLIDGSYITGRQIADGYVSNSSGNSVIRIDPNWYMTEGPGKYFTPETISGNTALALRTESAGTYNINEILSQTERTGSVSNYTTDVTSADYIARSFLFGGSSFRITERTVISDGRGNLTFRNIVIKPLDDNFDFDFSFKGGPAFPVFEGISTIISRKVDPDGTGKSLKIEFREEGQTNTQGGLTLQEFQGKSFGAPGAGFSTNARLDVRPPPRCFVAGTLIDMADGTKKVIENICPGDMVLSFDGTKKKGRGKLKAARVTKTFQNVTQELINLRGLKVTPGHVFLNGEGAFEKIATILKKDGAIVDKGGALLRARTGCAIGSMEDEIINVAYRDPMKPERLTVVVVRAGIPCIERADGSAWLTLAALIRGNGYTVKGAHLIAPDGARSIADWPEVKTPFDTYAQRNFIVRDSDFDLYTPDWIDDMREVDEEIGEIRRHMALA
jgi:hypothetical protein